MKRLLIANRGEIAVRIIHACREVGISPVAVYSEADAGAPHTTLADAAIPIGPAPAVESYLNIGRILDAARMCGADAIHPGYGFLSENPDFAASCNEAGITFVGPPADVIRLLGDKAAARRLAVASGVPVVPGYDGEDTSDERLLAEARAIGVPLLVKAVAGGGGRGMRVVRDLADLPAMLAEARREAEAAFGDARLLLERYLEAPHHVEFQVFGDTHGRVIHLFERECSIQRRHQKIIEESPSPTLTDSLRSRMADAALRVTVAAGYVNAGTVEFLVEERPDGDHRFYFLEVNARLQVEHPVTEMVTGLDLVCLQLAVADGAALPPQENVRASGHAVEVRVYAEDPGHGFQPSIGEIRLWEAPSAPGVRVDSGVATGSIVSPYYDPMLAKVIAHGEDRASAIARLENALAATAILGIRTNVPYLLAIVRNPAFQAGETSTDFLDRHLPGWSLPSEIPMEVLLALGAEAGLARSPSPNGSAPSVQASGDPYSPWVSTGAWRNARTS